MAEDFSTTIKDGSWNESGGDDEVASLLRIGGARRAALKARGDQRRFRPPHCVLLSSMFALTVVVVFHFWGVGRLPFSSSSSSVEPVYGGGIVDQHHQSGSVQNKGSVNYSTSDSANTINTSIRVKDFSYPENIPEIAWIMSFGGSGTSYTIVNTEALSGMTTASNYGRDYNPCLPVHPDYLKGPFVRSLHKPFPPRYILTKTHCGGFCMDCQVEETTLVDDVDEYEEAVARFESDCRTGKKRRAGGKVVSVTYPDKASAAVHLIRNPFDNIVGRMHLAIKHKDGELDYINNNVTGVLQWCDYLGSRHAPAVPRYANVPCVNEWFRYVQWHNMAVSVTEQIEHTHVLYYENYTIDFDATVDQLFDFLDLPVTSDPYPWHAGKAYSDFFDPSVASAVAEMMYDLASPKAWKLIKHYLEPFLDEDYAKHNTNVLDEEDSDDGDDEDSVSDDDDETAPAAESLPLLESDENPQVVWLMSFPNSGTSYTISNTEHVSNATTATNYEKNGKAVVVPVRPELTNGPFLHKSHLRVPHYVLTKTHCAGYCNDCSARGYISTQAEFERGCRRVDVDNTSNKHYDSSVPVKAVHLFRSPFDNIVARMHLSVKRKKRLGWTDEQVSIFENTKEGFGAWCNYLDKTYSKEEKSTHLIPDNVKELFVGLPCHADWYRYILWHNHALAVTKELDLPVHYLHYEDYSSKYNDTLSGLLDFLQLDRVLEPKYFIPGKTYRNLYEPEHAQLAAKLAKAVATPECWKLIRHYFEEWLE